MHLVGEPAGGGARGHPPVGVECEHRDRVVVLDVDDGFVTAVLEPLAPLAIGFVGSLRWRDINTALARELLSAPPDEQDMRRPFHDKPRKRDRVGNALYEGHAARAPVVGHDRCVKGDEPVAIGARAEADRHVGAVSFHRAAPRLNCIYRCPARGEPREGCCVGGEAVVPRGESDRACSNGSGGRVGRLSGRESAARPGAPVGTNGCERDCGQRGAT